MLNVNQIVSEAVSAAQKLAVRAYISADYGGPNPDLRAGLDRSDWTTHLDSKMKPSVGTRILHRGVSGGSFANVKQGDIVKDKGYMSTSTHSGTAHLFAGRPNRTPKGKPFALLHITAPRGTKSISVKNTLRGEQAFNKNENEHILARGTSIRIDKITPHINDEGEHVMNHIHATVVHQD